METMIESLTKHKVIPVITIDDAEDSRPLAEALVSAGLGCAEITFRTPAAEKSIEIMASMGDLLVAAGTVLNVDQVKRAMDAGARMIISPGLNPEVVRYCVENQISVIPGVCTPSEIETALGFGLDVVKFFPAEAFGGIRTLKAVSAPYPQLNCIPTGGINLDNLASYLSFEKVMACGGSWFVNSDLLRDHRFDTITTMAREAIELANDICNEGGS